MLIIHSSGKVHTDSMAQRGAQRGPRDRHPKGRRVLATSRGLGAGRKGLEEREEGEGATAGWTQCTESPFLLDFARWGF